ncbi:MAG: hypothetical protein L6416_01500 [Candidatus Omnitrophica bacterium]|nr:hypothetical protein [Candidatus Omnitrophota bacterium]
MIAQIDIDGTIDKAPEFFKWLTKSLKRDGHKVLIVTSRTTSPENDRETAREIKKYGVVYDRLILSPNIGDLDAKRFPPDMRPAHKLYIYKLFVAEDNAVDTLFDDCGITTELFRKYLPNVKVFKVLS